MDSDGNRVNVGNCDPNGVNVNNWNDDNPNDNIGVGASRKSKSHFAKEEALRVRRASLIIPVLI